MAADDNALQATKASLVIILTWIARDIDIDYPGFSTTGITETML